MDRCKSKTTEMHENEELKDFYGLKPVRFIKAESAGHGFASNDFNPIVGAFHGDVLPDAGPEEIELFFLHKNTEWNSDIYQYPDPSLLFR